MAQYNVSKKESREQGIPRVRVDGGGSSSGSSNNAGNQGIEGMDNTISPDAAQLASSLSPEAWDWIKGQDFGNNMDKNELERLNTKWMDANQGLSGTQNNLGVYNLDDDAFNITVPHLIPGTPEYEAAKATISTAYFDMLQQQLNASTEQEKAVADYNWQKLKKDTEKSLGITLSGNAFQAWDQLQSMDNQASQANIQGSGIQNESVDDYLANVRRSDQQDREETASTNDSNELEYLSKFATPEQIKQLVDSDPERARSIGLIPSDETRSALSVANMKLKYPNMSDDDINKKISMVLDTNGNYRSALYQKYMTGNQTGVQGGVSQDSKAYEDQWGNVLYTPWKEGDTGYLDIEDAKQGYLGANTPLVNQANNYTSGLADGSIKLAPNEDLASSQGSHFGEGYDIPALSGEAPKAGAITPGGQLPSSL